MMHDYLPEPVSKMALKLSISSGLGYSNLSRTSNGTRMKSADGEEFRRRVSNIVR